MAKLRKGQKFPVLDRGFITYLDHMGSDKTICQAARQSYGKRDGKTPQDDERLIMRLYRDKHTSPFEMGKIVFGARMPIFVMRQWIRHRMQNLNELSGRYTELPKDFYVPSEWRRQSDKNKQGSDGLFNSNENRDFTERLLRLCDDAYALYEYYLSKGVAREMARMVLPLNIYTEIVCCWDMHNLIHFLRLREDAHAQSEIQTYTKPMIKIANELFPSVIKSYRRYQHVVIDTEAA